MYTTLSSKGQITIPVAIRNSLRLNAGGRVDFVLFDVGRVELVPKKRSVTTLRGMIPHSGKPISLAQMDADTCIQAAQGENP